MRLPRVNGSSGPIGLSISGLPIGVTGTFSPNPVPATQTASTLTLTADSSAADTEFNPVDATITAVPNPPSPSVGPGPRTTPLSLRVAKNFSLSVNGLTDTNRPENTKVPIEVPDCAPG